MQSKDFAELPFRVAFPLWIESRTKLAPGSIAEYHKNYKRLESFFGDLPLSSIHIGHIREYVKGRKLKAGAVRINHEISTIQQMLKRAGTWATIADWYEPQPLPRSGPGIALEPEEESHLFRIAAKKKRWKVAYLASLLTSNTTAGPSEIRLLQLKDIDLSERMIFVRDGAKNKYRIRSIPLNEDGLWAVRELLERAKEKGCVEPEHYLLPARCGPPTKPMDSWKKAWYSLRKEAGKLYPRLLKLRRYDLRHHSMTRLLENPDISEQTIEDIAGHISHKMKLRYSHIRMTAKREALGSLCSPRKKSIQPERLRLTLNTSSVHSRYANGEKGGMQVRSLQARVAPEGR